MFKTTDTHNVDLPRKLQLGRNKIPRGDSYFLRAESFYNLSSYLGEIGAPGYGPKPLHEQSHGEAFLSLLVDRLSGNGLYLMDEPEAALSPQRQLTFLAALHDLVEPRRAIRHRHALADHHGLSRRHNSAFHG